MRAPHVDIQFQHGSTAFPSRYAEQFWLHKALGSMLVAPCVGSAVHVRRVLPLMPSPQPSHCVVPSQTCKRAQLLPGLQHLRYLCWQPGRTESLWDTTCCRRAGSRRRAPGCDGSPHANTLRTRSGQTMRAPNEPWPLSIMLHRHAQMHGRPSGGATAWG